MADDNPGPQTPGAFRRSVEDRIRKTAATTGRAHNELRRQYVYQRFLARVFLNPDSPWVLKGGVGMLVRMPDARYTRDVDLFHGRGGDTVAALSDLRAAVGESLDDFLTFSLGPTSALADGLGIRVPVTASVGAAPFERFGVDVSVELRPVGRPELIKPSPVIDVPGTSDLPRFRLYPVADQIADKICAMVEPHRGHPSSRYRDLVDLVLLLRTQNMAAAELTAALRSETRRRSISLATRVEVPGPAWQIEYPKQAAQHGLPDVYRSLDSALGLVNDAVVPALEGSVDGHRWNPVGGSWVTDET